MKKLILTAAIASSVVFANAQDMMSKKGTPILPEAGDWSIGFEVGPYLGNLFNGSNNNNGLSSQIPNTLVGLYVVDANTAYRAKFRLGFGSKTHNNLVDQDGSSTTPPAQVTDEWKSSSMNVTLGFGIQKSRGKGRLHGIYGVEAMIGLGSGKVTNSYGNPFSTTQTSPNSTTWNSAGVEVAEGGLSSRPTEEKAGSTFNFGLNGFIGAEYFFAPKMSVSAEYGWGLTMSSTGEGSSTDEYWDLTSSSVKTASGKTGKSSSFGLDVIDGGSLTLHLYF